MTHETSLSLLDRLKDTSNRKEWEIFVSLYHPLIAKYLKNFTIPVEDVEDLSQETLVATYRALPAFLHNGHVGAFRKWLRTIVQQRALNHLRNRKRDRSISISSCSDSLEAFEAHCNSLEEAWDKEHDHYVLDRLLNLIEPEFTTTTWLAFRRQVIDGESTSNVASGLGISVNAALIAKSRVMRKLRELSAGLVDDWDQ